MPVSTRRDGDETRDGLLLTPVHAMLHLLEYVGAELPVDVVDRALADPEGVLAAAGRVNFGEELKAFVTLSYLNEWREDLSARDDCSLTLYRNWVVEELRAHFGDKVAPLPVPRTAMLATAPLATLFLPPGYAMSRLAQCVFRSKIHNGRLDAFLSCFTGVDELYETALRAPAQFERVVRLARTAPHSRFGEADALAVRAWVTLRRLHEWRSLPPMVPTESRARYLQFLAYELVFLQVAAERYVDEVAALLGTIDELQAAGWTVSDAARALRAVVPATGGRTGGAAAAAPAAAAAAASPPPPVRSSTRVHQVKTEDGGRPPTPPTATPAPVQRAPARRGARAAGAGAVAAAVAPRATRSRARGAR